MNEKLLLANEIGDKWEPIKELYTKFKNQLELYTSPFCFDVGEERGCEDCKMPKKVCVEGGKGGLIAMFDLHLNTMGDYIDTIIKVLKKEVSPK